MASAATRALSRLSTPLLRAQSDANAVPLACSGLSLSLSSTTKPPLSRHISYPIRQRHSQTQVKRLFKKHPARARVFARHGMEKKPGAVPDRKYPKVFDPEHILPNGWSSPPGEDFELPNYPFHVKRTTGKANGAPGFLPVYSDCRKHGTKHTTIIRRVTGDRDAFLTELRAALGLPPRDDGIRIRTGGTIEVNGNRVREVKEWLGGLGF
mmetsp:Transcript_16043/g.32283  ORF Transcript_16043/g.32283 Transcript_16043/m.32283 type:complete len:210 (+) Transcript_16043:188-817(+)